MANASSQIQLQREIRAVSNKLDRLEAEVKVVLKRMGDQKNAGLEKGLKELRGGKGRLYKSMKEWSTEMKAQA